MHLSATVSCLLCSVFSVQIQYLAFCVKLAEYRYIFLSFVFSLQCLDANFVVCVWSIQILWIVLYDLLLVLGYNVLRFCEYLAILRSIA